MITRIAFAYLLSLLLSGCVTARVPEDRLKSIKSIAVVPVFEDTFNYEYHNVIVLLNEHEKKPIPEWNLNDHAGTKAMQVLAGRFEIASGVEVDRAAALSMSKDPGLMIKAIKPHHKNVDAYLFLVRQNHMSLRGNAATQIHGVGAQQHFRPLVTLFGERPPRYSVHAVYQAALVDARSGEVIAQQQSDVPPTSLHSAAWEARLYIRESEDWPKDFTALWEQKQERLRRFTFELLDISIPHTLQNLGLMGRPAAGK